MSDALARLSLQEFADRLASRQPVPGGGAVAAVTAAHAAALGCMVLEYTLGKPKFAAFEADNQAALAALRRAKNAALELADQDAAAYGRLSALWKLPAGDPKRAAQEPAALRDAIAAPMDILLLAQAVLAALQPLPARTNANLVSDLAIAAKLGDAAADAAAWNVRINLVQLPPGRQRSEAEARLAQAMASVRGAADSVAQAAAALMRTAPAKTT